ncbi:MAG: hypothetical protein ACI4V5_08050 [Prevotella sp.]
MKKILFVVAVMTIIAVNAHAYDYKYLAFEKSDGHVLCFDVEDIVIQQTEGTLVVKVGGVDTPLNVSELKRMFFTNDETDAIALPTVNETSAEEQVKVYNIAGELIGTYSSRDCMPKTFDAGVYIIKSEDKVVKTVKNAKR